MALAIAVGGFVVLVSTVSFLAKRYVRSSEDFYVAGRRMPWWAIGPTIAAGLFGGTSMLVVAGNTMTTGVSAVWILALPSWIGALVTTVLLARRVRRFAGTGSVPDLVGARYGPTTRTMFIVVTVFFYVGFTTSQLLALGGFVSVFTGIPLTYAMAGALLIGLALATASGFLGVVITDGLMCVLLAVGVGVLAVTGVDWAGGWSDLLGVLREEEGGYLSLFSRSITPPIALAYVAAFGLALASQQDILQRFASARSERDAFRGGLFALVIFVPLYLFPIVTGLAAKVWLPTVDGAENVAAEELVSWTTRHMYSPAVSAFLFVAVAAAILSTLTTTINSGALNLTNDIYLRRIHRGASQRHAVAAGRVGTLVVGLVALALATTFDVILDALFLAFSIAFAGMLAPIVAAFYWRRANGWGASASALTGSGFVIVDFALRQWGVPVPWPGEPYSLLIAFGISLVALVAGSLLTPPPAAESLTRFGRSAVPAETPVA